MLDLVLWSFVMALSPMVLGLAWKLARGVGNVVHLAWSEADSGSSAVTTYQILRGTVSGAETFTSDAAHNRFSNLVHWGYGTGWGAVRGLLDTAGLRPAAATAAHGLAVWGNAQVMLPVLEVAPPSFMWPKEEVAIDAWHHLVYATATGVAYEMLNGRNGRG